MKTTPAQIERALRNAATPAAKLAAWQNRGSRNNLAKLRKAIYHGDTLAARRKSLISHMGPEMSSPDAEKPLLWLDNLSCSLVLESWEGRDFLRHNGWYCDEFQEETIEGVAVRLAMFPNLIFEGVKSDGSTRVDLTSFEEIDYSDAESGYRADDCRTDAARTVIGWADSTAQRDAEKEQEYQAEERRKWKIEDNREALTTVRQSIRELCGELKSLCKSALPASYPAATVALQSSLKSLLRERGKLMKENRELANA